MLATYTLFYIMTVYSMTYSTAAAPVGLGLPRNEILWMLMMAVYATTTPLSTRLPFTKYDFGWVLLCIGMAIGAGTVLMPVQIGL
ncbi:hypothetical protein MJM04_30950, partial [Salmonella enterica subsp. enterica serovar Cerro]|nr:hypothetical protein [Salmonella enterica subsp. enterica serovar Cerro]